MRVACDRSFPVQARCRPRGHANRRASGRSAPDSRRFDARSQAYRELDGDDYVAFYDRNEQHRILGEDIEAYLAPIYERGCRFVIAVLGPKYGEKRWTIFESERFKERFGDGNVIPIWEKDSLPSAFDTTGGIGFLTFDPDADPRDEARRLADVIKRKYDEDLVATTGPPQIELDLASAP